MKHKVIQGNNIDILKTYPDNHFDSIVTDPPYGIEFLGKDWDSNTGAVETWAQCLRVLKPGGYLLAFSAARTYHHLATNIEGVGFEIRDQLMWLYSSGFPKAQDVGKAIDKRNGKKQKYTYTKNAEDTRNVKNSGTSSTPYCIECDANMSYPPSQCDKLCAAKSPPMETAEAKQWAGWKTALKPAHEPIVMARKPFKGSTIDNVLTHGIGALNIDATRIEWDEKAQANIQRRNALGGEVVGCGIAKYATVGESAKSKHETQRIMLNEQGRFPSNVIGEVEGYQKFFYCPKVSRKERHCGFDDASSTKSMLDDMAASYIDEKGNLVPYEERNNKPQIHIPGIGIIYTHGLKQEYLNWCKANNVEAGNVGNNHPTVKPVELMRYLIKLVTPPGGTVLDPFTGSGSTGMAAVELGHTFVGCELDPAYVDIANTRITAWNKPDLPEEFFE